ncbi:Homeobox protein unplugged [Armadillidium nasatum]|uniref:Homeobox protein unplugged n=1 Tax=Armadillidium nasatum TaxID=96803 RepID=A0A5N5SV31_9CRUS|nr:Homeobox protein unplugged [Armadillidium nasatum]
MDNSPSEIYSKLLKYIPIKGKIVQVKIWFQNRRAKWKRVKAGLVSGGGSGGGKSSNGHKIVVPIPVHVNRLSNLTQSQQGESKSTSHTNGSTSSPSQGPCSVMTSFEMEGKSFTRVDIASRASFLQLAHFPFSRILFTQFWISVTFNQSCIDL